MLLLLWLLLLLLLLLFVVGVVVVVNTVVVVVVVDEPSILMSAMTQPAMPAECKVEADDAIVPGEGCPQQGSCSSSNNNNQNKINNNHNNNKINNNNNNNHNNNKINDNNNMPPTAQMEAHRLGVCVPCTYFALKADGCRNGDECTWCHICTVDTAKSWRRQLRAEARFRKRTPAGKQFGNYQVEVQKEFGTSRSAAALGLEFQPSKVKNTSVHFSIGS
ncbi:unnamed protein product [Polarella glacialis]|uniref:C3H1-type domain-containing protein n=2 Tax=Polarella glacialis TaxID=89957 RepID=A0A813E1V6_POLGL|nr:unnamed protein product [Polarella glacialis]